MEGIKSPFKYKAKKRLISSSLAPFVGKRSIFVPKQVLTVHRSQMPRKDEMQPWPEDKLEESVRDRTRRVISSGQRYHQVP